MLTGKALRILNRFPDFYSAENPNNLLIPLVDLFGQLLDTTEADLIRVLRSHYVDTADNDGSQGLFGREKGDLDRIFALYLETLGGTSRLMQVNQTFQTTDIRQLSAFITELVEAKSAIAQDIWLHFPSETQARLRHYLPAQAQFEAHFSRSLIIRLIAAQDALTRFLRDQFSPTTRQALEEYDGTEPIAIALNQTLASDFNRMLRNSALRHRFAERQTQIQLARSIQNLLEVEDSNQIVLAQSLRKRLSLVAQRLLSPLPREPLEPAKLQATLIEELPIVLKQPSLCQLLLNALAEPAPISDAFPLSQTAIALLLQSALTTLTTILFGSTTAPLEVPSLSSEAQRLLEQSAIADDLVRLNRLLLEAAYSDLPKSEMPTMQEVQSTLVQALNQQILLDPMFATRNRSSFVDLELPVETLEQSSLNRKLLESLYPNSLEKSYSPYRERLRHLISVLKNGASTKEGIVDIAAANLGIRTDGLEGKVKPWEMPLFDLSLTLAPALQSLTASPGLRRAFLEHGIGISYSATVAMEELQRRWVITDIDSSQVYVIYRLPDRFSVYRALIRVIEFLPEPLSFSYQIHPQPAIADSTVQLPLPTTFTVHNPNVLVMTPTVQIRIRDRRSNTRIKLSPLINLTLTNATTQQFVKYRGSLNCDEVILFLPDGTVLINGVVVADADTVIEGRIPELPIQNSEWNITALTGSALARLDTTLFDFCRFDTDNVEQLDSARSSSYQLEVSIGFTKLTPGSFMVKIPWDMPGYTDQFDETSDHPRHQISRLIEKVKASGVQSVVTYEKQFSEAQDTEDILTVKRSPFQDLHDITALNPIIRSQQKPYGLGVEHEMTDTLITNAVFDYTYFDALNTFG